MYGKGQGWNARAISLGKWESHRGGQRDVADFRPLWQTTQKHSSSMQLDTLAADTGSSLPGYSLSSPPNMDPPGGNSSSFTTWVLIFPEPLLGERA